MCSATTLPPLAPSQELHYRDACAKPHTAYRKPSHHIAKVVNAQIQSGFLTADEAHALIASYAARTLSSSLFEWWGIPFVGHRAQVIDTGPRGGWLQPG